MDKIEKLKENDKIGGPKCYTFPKTGPISPTTLRYMKVASDIKFFFGNQLGETIVEIGGGYGGQCLIFDILFSFKCYTIFDLQPVLVLISKFLEHYPMSNSYSLKTINKVKTLENIDLIISNYAFSELPAILQKIYIEKVIKFAKRGYMTMNTGLANENNGKHLNLDELKELLPKFKILDERPLTGKNNYIIVWGFD